MTGPRDPDTSYNDDTDELAALRDKVEVLRRENALLNATLDAIAELLKQFT